MDCAAEQQATSHHMRTNMVCSPSLKLPSSCSSFRKGYKLLIWWKTQVAPELHTYKSGGLAFQSSVSGCVAHSNSWSSVSRLPGCASLMPVLCQHTLHYTEDVGLHHAPHRLLLLKALPSLHWSISANEAYIVPFCLSQVIQITRQLSVFASQQ